MSPCDGFVLQSALQRQFPSTSWYPAVD
jgi:hypothetical protein